MEFQGVNWREYHIQSENMWWIIHFNFARFKLGSFDWLWSLFVCVCVLFSSLPPPSSTETENEKFQTHSPYDISWYHVYSVCDWLFCGFFLAFSAFNMNGILLMWCWWYELIRSEWCVCGAFVNSKWYREKNWEMKWNDKNVDETNR